MAALDLVRRFAVARDNNNFGVAGVMLSEACTYASPQGLLVGRHAILASYAAAAGRAADSLDRVVNSSNVVERGENRFVIEYTDRLHAGRLVHTYHCEQHVTVIDEAIHSVTHVELSGERPALEAFLSRVGRRVVVVIYPGCVLYEVMLAIELVGEHTRVDLVSPDGESVTLQTGFCCMADASFATAPRSRVAGVLVPGGDPGDLLGNAALSEWLGHTHRLGAQFGAICAGPLLLGDAGLLRGRQFTHGYGTTHADKLAPFWQDAHYRDAPIVEDGPVLTAQPQAHVGFGVRFAERLGLLDADSASRAREFYLGQRRFRGTDTLTKGPLQ